MKVNREALRKTAGRSYRYVGFEADGEPAGSSMWYVQRPTAVQKARLYGFGLYDRREDEVIVEPDPELRVEQWQQRLDRAIEEKAEAEERIEKIRKANRVGISDG